MRTDHNSEVSQLKSQHAEELKKETDWLKKDKVDTVEVILLAIHDFLKKETPEIMAALDYEINVEDTYTDPDEEDATELGEVPHEDKKGSIDPNYKNYQIIYRI